MNEQDVKGIWTHSAANIMGTLSQKSAKEYTKKYIYFEHMKARYVAQVQAISILTKW